jgi:two-component system KDP operon response regulator KdpE
MHNISAQILRHTGTQSPTRKSHIVVADDHDGRYSSVLHAQLVKAGYQVTMAPSLAAAARPDAALVVAWLTGPDPAAQVAKVRSDLRPPMIVIIPDGETAFLTVIELYEAGVDDCMTEPMDIGHLTAGVNRLLDGPRATTAIEAHQAPAVVTPLLPIERRILAGLIGHATQPVTRRQLADQVWGPHRTDQDGILRVYLHLIGRKLAEPDRLVTHPRVQFR